MNNKNNVPKYQISGIQPNYSYANNQNLTFDQSSISSTGYSNPNQLENAVNQQQNYINNYNNFKPLSTFDKNVNNSANLENLKDYSQFNINNNFKSNKPIMFMPDNKNKHETLYDNLNENLLREALKEYRLNIDSSDRNVILYPDPFNYVVYLGPITNSGIAPVVSKPNLTSEYRSFNKKNNISNNYVNNIQNNIQNNVADNPDEKIFIFDNPDLIKEYTLKLERSFDPNIIRDFKNVYYVRLDCAVIPRYNSICINKCWNFCRKKHHQKNFFKDEYDRIKDYCILNNRYIPDDRNEYNPLGDRFIQIFIKELQSIRNFGTNPVTDKSFLLIYDKTLGALYLKLIPYSATKTYPESLLGNLNKLSIQFFDSWGQPLTINTTQIDYEKNQILNTILIDPAKCCISKFLLPKNKNFEEVIKNLNEIIKCFIIINYDVEICIPFYTPFDYLNNNTNIQFHDECIDNKLFYINQKKFDIKNLYEELDAFVTPTGFIEQIKINKNKNKIKLNINEYLNNVLWFDFNIDNYEQIYHNVESFDYNYKNFGFNILDKLKTEIINIPVNRNFQNFLTFLVGIWENELNTKIDYRN